jgi:hypothetical protein
MDKYFNEKIFLLLCKCLNKEYTKAPSIQSLYRNSDILQVTGSSHVSAEQNDRLVLALGRPRPPAFFFFCVAAGPQFLLYKPT